MGSCLKRKEALMPPTRRQALLAAFQLTLREGEEERRRQRMNERETKIRGKVVAILTECAIQSVNLDMRLKPEVKVR